MLQVLGPDAKLRSATASCRCPESSCCHSRAPQSRPRPPTPSSRAVDTGSGQGSKLAIRLAGWLANPNNTPTRTEGGLSPPHARAGCSRLGLTVAPGVRHRHHVTSRHGTLAVVNKTRRCDGRTGSSFPDVASA